MEQQTSDTKKVVAYDTRADGIDYRVCPKCVDRRQFSGSEVSAVFVIRKGDIEFCEVCDKPLG
jgi:hypothetical protein